MKEEVLIKRTNSQIKARRLVDSHYRQSSNNSENCTLLGLYAPNYHYSLRNNPEESSSHLLSGGSVESLNFIIYEDCIIRASAQERLATQCFFFTAEMKRFVLNRSESTDGCFTALFFQTQHASFSGRCGSRSALGDGNGTQKNTHACANKRQTNRTATRSVWPPVFVCCSKSTYNGSRLQIFDSERLITEVEEGPARYNNATPKYSDKNCKEKLWIKVCEVVVPN
jgi:hypothetical protein